MFCGEGQATSSMLYQEFGCDAVLCRPGTFSVYGHATLYSACRPCPSEVDSNVSSSVVIDDKNPPLSAILGRTSCNGVEFVHGDLNGDGEVSPREVLRMLYVDTLGRFWGPDYRTWADMKVPECSLTGVTCANGQIVKIDLGSASLCSDGDRKPAPLIFCKGLPRELGLLATLEYLHLQRQKFLRGTLPSEVGQLRELRVLDLTGCSSIVSTLPTELGMLTNLVSMKITGTKFYGRVPPELFQLPNLSVIHLSNNHFTGTIPPMRLPSVKELLISRNDLTGSIPSDLTPLARLENFEAYHNKLTGRIPSQMGDCSSLKRIGTSDFVGQSALLLFRAARVSHTSFCLPLCSPPILSRLVREQADRPASDLADSLDLVAGTSDFSVGCVALVFSPLEAHTVPRHPPLCCHRSCT
jgi:hypothetical protein